MLDKAGDRSSCFWKASRELFPKEVPFYGLAVTLLQAVVSQAEDIT